jgi:hypothetical protein
MFPPAVIIPDSLPSENSHFSGVFDQKNPHWEILSSHPLEKGAKMRML